MIKRQRLIVLLLIGLIVLPINADLSPVESKPMTAKEKVFFAINVSAFLSFIFCTYGIAFYATGRELLKEREQAYLGYFKEIDDHELRLEERRMEQEAMKQDILIRRKAIQENSQSESPLIKT